MPIKINWTEAMDGQLRRLRAEGESWDAIAAALSVSRYTAIDRGRRIGARRPPPEHVPPPEDPGRAPLAAGHPRSWDCLNAGTCLAGTPYPLPFFSR